MDLASEIRKKANKEKAAIYQRFFKTGKGEYGEGDKFLGLSVPDSREIAKRFVDLGLNEIKKYLESEWHEDRLIALLILVEKYKAKKDSGIVDFYLENLKYVNNWDLVDLTADKILGDYLIDKDRKKIYSLVKSQDLWEKRVAIVSCYRFIRNNDFSDALNIYKSALSDKRDLIHKAVGWMLREVGKRNEKILKDFLRDNYSELPRTTLRYAIERFPEDERKAWLKGLSP
ncbi:DNA alkylation repair protein [Candidatus Pacearchaeota archaeon CG_4_9_14_0_2_um_filter_39_13]|nr:DNA alkylation repair protein [Candidatus Pacearchaeota archaeon]OIO43564.1 MAG: DNA alkylation repair protein [Candidatus Pacearchaeota archaeon CG1_02_39_14]PJC45129.1 MAG: DNA alkylation repair protein [Candidatus Pacearchaeota archaeon CG_4_9_14_0_2_um_filter_39_13]